MGDAALAIKIVVVILDLPTFAVMITADHMAAPRNMVVAASNGVRIR